jgi:hypothetical protein
MVMHNELNDNSTTPEKAPTHHYDESGALVVTDVIQYFQHSIERPDIYSLRLNLTGTREAVLSLIHTSKRGSISSELPFDQAEALWSHVVKSQHELASTFGVSVVETKEAVNCTRRRFSITKKTRVSADSTIQQKSAQMEAYKFLEAAYIAGINIIIEGQTGSGKSRLLNTLMDSAKDYNPTVLICNSPEMVFGNDHREITEIRGNLATNPRLAQVLRMSPHRVVMDDVFVDEKTMKAIVTSAMSGTQFVVTGYTNSSEVATSDTDRISSRYAEHPYELRVHVALSGGDNSTQSKCDILSVQQIVHQKIGNSDTTSNRLLFDHEKMVAEPTRTLRRKMEAARKREAVKPTVVSIPAFGETPVPALVSITPEEKVLLEAYRDDLREHFKTENILLRAKFREIDWILAKF